MQTHFSNFRLILLGMILAPVTMFASSHPIASPAGQSIPIALTSPSDSALERGGPGLSVFVAGANHIVGSAPTADSDGLMMTVQPRSTTSLAQF